MTEMSAGFQAGPGNSRVPAELLAYLFGIPDSRAVVADVHLVAPVGDAAVHPHRRFGVVVALYDVCQHVDQDLVQTIRVAEHRRLLCSLTFLEIEKNLQEIKELGFTTVIVEPNVIAALNLADRAVILDMGQVVYDGSAKEVLENADLRHQYLAL